MSAIASQSCFATAPHAHESMLLTSTLRQQGLDLDLRRRRVSFIDVKTASAHTHTPLTLRSSLALAVGIHDMIRIVQELAPWLDAIATNCNLVHCNAITVHHLLPLLQQGLGLSLRCWRVPFISSSRFGLTHQHQALLLCRDS